MPRVKEKNKGGKPPLTREDVDAIFRKLEPYLKQGLSAKKACLAHFESSPEDWIPISTVYDLIRENRYKFAERVDASKQFLSRLVSNLLTSRLVDIYKNKNEGIGKEDEDFIKWMALNSKASKDEFGVRNNIQIDNTESEIQKIFGLIEEKTQKEG